MANISYYGSHNSALTIESDGEILCVIEIERFIGYKNGGLAQYKVIKHNGKDDLIRTINDILEYIKNKFGIEEFDNCLYCASDIITDNSKNEQEYVKTHEFIPAKNYLTYPTVMHHKSHAAGAFYQSDYKESLIFSFDGGGDDGKFNVYHCLRGESPRLLERVMGIRGDYDLGFPYMIFAHYLDDINFEDISEGNLVYGGKLMGLVSYGEVKSEWLEYFIEFYDSQPYGGDYQEKINELGEKINIVFDVNNRLKGQLAWDVASTAQRAFEECFLKIAKPYMDEYKNLPICIAGGCGLNIILNTRLVIEFKKDVFVGPNPNDCGLSLGMMLDFIKPEKPVDATYLGLPILDSHLFNFYYQKIPYYNRPYELKQIAKDLKEGDIIGVMRGGSEHGPRALGNRSILCNPTISDMKDILNMKVKNREWFRPFAPVVRLEDVSKYFEWDRESRWMSFAPVVKEEWREILKSITHVDNTARVQTVTRNQNEWLYDLLTFFEEETGVGVILNTSFNVNGQPILTTINDAMTVLTSTSLDGIIIEDRYIKKKYGK
jgi:carbamoyltransferase